MEDVNLHHLIREGVFPVGKHQLSTLIWTHRRRRILFTIAVHSQRTHGSYGLCSRHLMTRTSNFKCSVGRMKIQLSPGPLHFLHPPGAITSPRTCSHGCRASGS